MGGRIVGKGARGGGEGGSSRARITRGIGMGFNGSSIKLTPSPAIRARSSSSNSNISSSSSSSSSSARTLGSSASNYCSNGSFVRVRSASTDCATGTSIKPLSTNERGVIVQRQDVFTGDPANNVSEHIFERLNVNNHRRPNHPLCILKEAIYDYFRSKKRETGSIAVPTEFTMKDDFAPLVAISANFDEILIPADHVSRSPNDTYYVDSHTCLRCHTSAHQAHMLRDGYSAFLVTGDVYRRDSIDATHYPVFHQMEGVRVFEPKDWENFQKQTDADDEMDIGTAFCFSELKIELEGLARHLFGDVSMRWVDAYFPFTDPSAELEIYFNDEWMEVLGCGVTQQSILDSNGRAGAKAWAFGLGLERLAMVLFDIPDIRLFWSEDERFTSQFKEGNMKTKFTPYSKYPPVFKDMSFWINSSSGEEGSSTSAGQFTENNLCSLVRDVAGDLAEEVKLIDKFTHPKTGRDSECYRITYRSMERSLTNEEIDQMQEVVRREAVAKLGIELR